MYHMEIDTHVHSVASVHAYSTIEECALHARSGGLRGFAITDHCSPVMAQREGSVEAIGNQKMLPPIVHGVRVIKGVEIDIVDTKGKLAFADTPSPFDVAVSGAEWLLSSREFVIASIHVPMDRNEGTMEENTEMYCRVLANPYVDVLGHIGRAKRPFDISRVLQAAKQYCKAIEINDASLRFYGSSSLPRCREIALLCKTMGVLVAIGSDAHESFRVGDFEHARRLLQEIEFPEPLIVNRTLESFEEYLQKRKSRIQTGAQG